MFPEAADETDSLAVVGGGFRMLLLLQDMAQGAISSGQ